MIAARNGFEVLRFLVMQSSFSFIYLELLAVPTASLINNPGHLSTGEFVFVFDVCFGKQLEGQSSRRIY